VLLPPVVNVLMGEDFLLSTLWQRDFLGLSYVVEEFLTSFYYNCNDITIEKSSTWELSIKRFEGLSRRR